MIGTLIGERYRIRGKLGEGGMAGVYTAIDERLDRRVAIKIMHEKLAGDKGLRQRFLLEAKTLSSFDHPNIIRVLDYSGNDSPELWIVTEILQGYNLSQFIAKFPEGLLNPILASFIADEVCSALFHSHSMGIYHRDVKPENVFALRDGRIKLMDFGIAKDTNRHNITLTGTFMGSPSYMSPEQIKGTRIDGRSDIYSLSVMLYEMTTGKLPFPGANPSQVINKIMQGNYLEPGVIAPWIPVAIQQAIVKGMHHDPHYRFQEITGLQQQIRQYLATIGMGESSKELSSYFLNRATYEQNLRVHFPATFIPEGHALSTKTISKMVYRSRGPVAIKDSLGDLAKIVSLKPRSKPVSQHSSQHASKAAQPSPTDRHIKNQQSSLWWETKAKASAIIGIAASLAFLALSLYYFVGISRDLEVLRQEAIEDALYFSKLKDGQRKQLRNRSNTNPLNDTDATIDPKGDASKLHQIPTVFEITPIADIWIDGKYYGLSSSLGYGNGIPLSPGLHQIKLTARNFETFEQTIDIRGAQFRFVKQLSPKIQQKSVQLNVNKFPTKITIRPKNPAIAPSEEFELLVSTKILNLKPGEYELQATSGDNKVVKEFSVQSEGSTETIEVQFEP